MHAQKIYFRQKKYLHFLLYSTLLYFENLSIDKRLLSVNILLSILTALKSGCPEVNSILIFLGHLHAQVPVYPQIFMIAGTDRLPGDPQLHIRCGVQLLHKVAPQPQHSVRVKLVSVWPPDIIEPRPGVESEQVKQVGELVSVSHAQVGTWAEQWETSTVKLQPFRCDIKGIVIRSVFLILTSRTILPNE